MLDLQRRAGDQARSRIAPARLLLGGPRRETLLALSLAPRGLAGHPFAEDVPIPPACLDGLAPQASVGMGGGEWRMGGESGSEVGNRASVDHKQSQTRQH